MQKVTFDEVLAAYEQVKNPDPYQLWAINKANEQHNGEWYLGELSRGMFERVILPFHQHPNSGKVLVPSTTASLAEALKILFVDPEYRRTNAACWETIQFLADSKSPVILSVSPVPNRDYKVLGTRASKGLLYHVDGLHRLLTSGLQENISSIPVFIAGKPNDQLKF